MERPNNTTSVALALLLQNLMQAHRVRSGQPTVFDGKFARPPSVPLQQYVARYL